MDDESILTISRSLLCGITGTEQWRGFVPLHGYWTNFCTAGYIGYNQYRNREKGLEYANDLYMAAKSNFGWTKRSEAENNPTIVQPIPYCLIRIPGQTDRTPCLDDLYFHYKRSKSTTEKRLLEKVSMGVGGHINHCDLKAGEDIFRVAGMREIQEEFDVPTECVKNIYTVGLLRTGTGAVDDVNSYHLGIVMVVDVPIEVEVHSLEDKNVPLGWVKARDLLQYFDPLPEQAHLSCGYVVESWTQDMANVIYASAIDNKVV